MSRPIKLLVCLAISLAIWILPVPNGITSQAWHLLAIFAGTIAGFILQPLPIGAVAILACVLSVILGVLKGSQALEGFSSSLIWLIVAAFMFAAGFIKTGLGARIAYHLLHRFGSSTLAVSYVLTATDLIASPFTPSNTARGGGIVFPIAQSICSTLGCVPGRKNSRTGAFLMYVCYSAALTSACIFMTASSTNVASTQFAKDLWGIDISWMLWFAAASVPGLLITVITPPVLRFLIKPELNAIPEIRREAADKIQALGPMSHSEKALCLIFAIALLLWCTSDLHGIEAAWVALLGLSAMLLTRVLSWEDILEQRGAWDVLIWMGIMLNFASYLSKLGLMDWVAKQSVNLMPGASWLILFAILAVIYNYIHYGLASTTAHILALFTAFGSVVIAAGAPVLPVVIIFSALASSSAFLTHFGCGVTPIFFGAGYLSQSQWWKVGLILATMQLVIWVGIGLPWMMLID